VIGTPKLDLQRRPLVAENRRHALRPGNKEPWRPYQKDWLKLLAEFLGPDSAVELRFVAV
jgi:hypothetical protein